MRGLRLCKGPKPRDASPQWLPRQLSGSALYSAMAARAALTGPLHPRTTRHTGVVYARLLWHLELQITRDRLAAGAVLCRIGARELGTKQHNLRGIVDIDQEQHDGCRGAIEMRPFFPPFRSRALG